jgi:hypothetical protein
MITAVLAKPLPLGRNWTLSHQEALEMIAHEIGRILNGDPNYADNWHDVGGYSKLVEDRLPKDGAA